ncbi:MAG TPA: UDP-N-acetylglucosamine 2-epimerase (non-hydrolyzing) [Solirubrobacteraceae bacterium]|nr:UDP-N-acetylglucosamine 2-epimerase (non-hydrolyzing) [Solirubrobacteraceae bacterium]
MKVVTVIGNRPQFVKAAAVSGPLRAEHEELLVHTGQHYDDELSAIFVRELDVPAPDIELALGGGTNTAQTARMLAALGDLLREHAPDAVLVYGDTNSTLAGALAAAQARIPVAHVEAGMRSFDRAMPEELNRVLTDHLADLLLVPSASAAANLAREGVAGEVEVVGDVMVDVARLLAPRAAADDAPLHEAGVRAGGYVLATAHRAGTVDDPRRLAALVDLLLSLDVPVVLPLHPRTRARLEAAGLLDRLAAGTILRPPLGYLAFTSLLTRASAVLTDSGGVQKEAYLAGVPCVTLRDSTEWVETVATGWNVLVDLDAAAARAAVARDAPDERPALYGDGHAGGRVAAAMARLQRS